MQNAIETPLFSDAERAAIDPDGLLRKFLDERVANSVVAIPAELLPQAIPAGVGEIRTGDHYYSENAIRRYGIRTLDRDVGNTLTAFVADVVAACLLYNDRATALALVQRTSGELQRVVMTGKADSFGYLGCSCDWVGSLWYHVRRFGLAEIEGSCRTVLCPSYDIERGCPTHEPGTTRATPKQEVIEHLQGFREHRATRWIVATTGEAHT